MKLHPIMHISHSPLAHLHRQEQLTSGYPLLSPTGITLTQAVVSLIYQLQEKEPWKSAITQVGGEGGKHVRVRCGREEGEMWEGEVWEGKGGDMGE